MRFRISTFDEILADPDAIHHVLAPSDPQATASFGVHTLTDTAGDVVELANASVIDGGGITWKHHWIDGNEIQYYSTNWANEHWRPGDTDAARTCIEINQQRLVPRTHVSDPALFCDSHWASLNFGHFVHDFLPYGRLYRILRESVPEVVALAHEMPWNSQRRVMDAVFGASADRFAPIEGTTLVDRLFLARRQSRLDGVCWTTSFAGLRAARRYALASFRCDVVDHVSAIADPIKVFLHREQDEAAPRANGMLRGRDFGNVNDLARALLAAGFVLIEPGRVPIATVALLLARAAGVVGIHGANMGNILFCQPGTRVVEVRPATGVWSDYEAIGHVLDHDFIGLGQPAAEAGAPPRIDVAGVLAKLRS